MTLRFLLPLLLVSYVGFAQSAFRLRGVIRDSQTKEPVSFASIGVAATPVGTHSNQHDVLDDDSRWFALLKELQAHFRHRIVHTSDVVSFFNQRTGKDLTSFFTRYLHYPAIPTLKLQFKPQGSGQAVFYRWKADVKDFNMPVKGQFQPGQSTFIHPTTKWQKLKTRVASPQTFEVAEAQFYVNVIRTVKQR